MYQLLNQRRLPLLTMLLASLVVGCTGQGDFGKPGLKRVLEVKDSSNQHLIKTQCLEISTLGVNYEVTPYDCDDATEEHQWETGSYLFISKCAPPGGCTEFKGKAIIKGGDHTGAPVEHDWEMRVAQFDSNWLPLEIYMDAKSHTSGPGGDHGGSAHLK